MRAAYVRSIPSSGRWALPEPQEAHVTSRGSSVDGVRPLGWGMVPSTGVASDFAAPTDAVDVVPHDGLQEHLPAHHQHAHEAYSLRTHGRPRLALRPH